MVGLERRTMAHRYLRDTRRLSYCLLLNVVATISHPCVDNILNSHPLGRSGRSRRGRTSGYSGRNGERERKSTGRMIALLKYAAIGNLCPCR